MSISQQASQAEATHIDAAEEIELPERRTNRPVTLMHRVEYIAMRGLFAFFRLIGIDASSSLAGTFTRQVGPLLKPITARADNNLRAAFPNWSEAEIRQCIKGVWENLGRTAAEMAHLEKLIPGPEDSRITIYNQEQLDAFKENGTPVIFVSSHMANWEAMSVVVHKWGFDYGVVYRAANNPLIDELIINLRAAVMSRRQIPKGKRGGRAVIETLREGRSLAMLVDQKLNDGIEAEFFGRQAMTAPAPARLALKFNVPIVPMSIVRRRGAHFDLYIREPISFTPTGETSKDVATLTQLINDAIEAEIRAHPEQWLWLHRRWPKKGSNP
ncbi:MAG: lauroyl acyltransferase [Pseudomonadota bacterium]